MKIQVNAEIQDITGEVTLTPEKIYTVIGADAGLTILKESGKGNKPLLQVKTWKLAKVCDKITSPRGGARKAGEGKKVGRPPAEIERKSRSIRCTEKEYFVLKKVFEDIKSFNKIDSQKRYKQEIRRLLSEAEEAQK